MKHLSITSADQLSDFCQYLADVPEIALDTEFVSEDSYRPQLCLIQVATRDRLAVIDTLAVDDVRPFWALLGQGEADVIVHAGREELGFCLEATDQRIAKLFDTQIAAGMVGAEYPAGYASLVSRFLNIQPDKGQTRTDWRRRPLTKAQVRYALEDVRYLLPLHDKLQAKLKRLQRHEWLAAEMAAFQQQVDQGRSRQRWRKVAGISGLSGQSLAIVRELWQWRDNEARRRNIPAKRVLRDDLLAEIARQRNPAGDAIRGIRGMERPGLRRAIDDLAACVERGLAGPAVHLPRRPRRDSPPQLNILGQFLSSALGCLCQQAQIAPSIVGTASDVRELVEYRLNPDDSPDRPQPALVEGWRAQIVGTTIDALLSGMMSIRIRDPQSHHPLAFERVAAPPAGAGQ